MAGSVRMFHVLSGQDGFWFRTDFKELTLMSSAMTAPRQEHEISVTLVGSLPIEVSNERTKPDICCEGRTSLRRPATVLRIRLSQVVSSTPGRQ